MALLHEVTREVAAKAADAPASAEKRATGTGRIGSAPTPVKWPDSDDAREPGEVSPAKSSSKSGVQARLSLFTPLGKAGLGTEELDSDPDTRRRASARGSGSGNLTAACAAPRAPAMWLQLCM